MGLFSDGLGNHEKTALEVVLIRIQQESLKTKALLFAIAILSMSEQDQVCPIPTQGDPAYPFYEKIKADLGELTKKGWQALAQRLAPECLGGVVTGSHRNTETSTWKKPEGGSRAWETDAI